MLGAGVSDHGWSAKASSKDLKGGCVGEGSSGQTWGKTFQAV